MQRKAFFGIGLAVVLVAGTGCGAARSDAGFARVLKVFDGDTVLLSDGGKVRLIGIDCPEAYDSDKLFRDARRENIAPRIIMAMGRRASAFTRELLSGRDVLVRYDEEKRDKYHRLLAYLFVPVCIADKPGAPPPCRAEAAVDGQEPVLLQGPDGRYGIYIFVNATIVKSGYAQVMTIPPNTRYAKLFERLYHEALEEKRGLWEDHVP